MKTNKWYGIGLAVTMLTSVTLAGCSSTSEPASSDKPAATKEEQTLNLVLGSEIPTMDSSKATDNLAFLVLGQVNEGLVRLDEKGKPIPGVASKWDISPDGLTYTFTLRDNAKWSDGSAVTAKDFEYAWKRTLNPDTKSGYAFMLAWLKGGKAYSEGKGKAEDVGVTAKDDKTLVVTLENPTPFFLEQTNFPSFYPQKQETVEKHGEKYGADADKVVFNGPFKMTSWEHEQSATLERNDNYWDKDAVKLGKVNYVFVKDSNAVENLYQAGQVDRAGLVRDQVDRYKDTAEFSTLGDLSVGYLQYNSKLPVFQNAKVRKALTYAVDGERYADLIYHNGSKGATGFVPAGISNGQGGDFRADNSDLINRKENAAKAKELLQQGLQEAGLTEFPKLKLIYDDGDMGSKVVAFLKEQWRQNLGIDIEVENIPFKLKLQRSRAGDFDIVMSLWIGDYNDPMTFLDLWVSDSGFNDPGYNSPKYDELIHNAQKEPDTKKRMTYLQDAEKLLMEDMPIGPVFFRGSSVVMKPYVKGWVNRVSSPEYDLKGVYIEGKK